FSRDWSSDVCSSDLKTAAASNPDLAPAATQFTMQNFAQKQNLANALALEDAKRKANQSTTLTPQEVAGLGLPQGTVAQRGANGQMGRAARRGGGGRR